MKKILIIASAILIGVSASFLASAQNATGKTQPQKATSVTTPKPESQKAATSVAAAKQEPVKQNVKIVRTETKAPAAVAKTPATTKTVKRHKLHADKAVAPVKEVQPAATPKK
jgi:hypothetical protein